MRTVAVVTSSRADFGLLRPVLRRVRESRRLRLRLMATGMHLSPGFGRTAAAIEREGFRINDRLMTYAGSDDPVGVAAAMGAGLAAFGRAFARRRPDLLVVLGDRYDMYPAAAAALPFRIPVAHIRGGERTEGAMDEALRHSLTKLSHLHFVSHREHARRVVQLGESPWRVTVSGDPGLDDIRSTRLLSPRELEAAYGLRLSVPPLLVTFHPETLDADKTSSHVRELLAALAASGRPLIFTAPNADTHGGVVLHALRRFLRGRRDAWLIENLGTRAYFSVMAAAGAMVGNSSSGIVEAPSFGLPVVNVGKRQQGRLRAANVVDVGHGRAEIAAGIRRALRPAFRARFRGLKNPYGDGRAAGRIVARLETVPLGPALITKRFHDYRGGRRGDR